MSSFKDPSFKKLQAEYYQKLKEEGFEDIENNFDKNVSNSVASELNRRRDFKPEAFEAKRDYFIWATHQVESGHFVSEQDKTIWVLYADGHSTRDIGCIVHIDHSVVVRRIAKIKLYLREAELALHQFDQDDGYRS